MNRAHILKPGPWRCRACHELRPDEKISVKSLDLSQAWGLPPGTMQENFCYCNDRPACVEAAANYQGRKPPPRPAQPERQPHGQY